MCIDSDGTRSFLFADKRAIIQDLNLNIPIRDMRLLDFNLFTSGKILLRDNAIIFTIEHVRLIITANKVIIPREGYEHSPLGSRYVDVLEEAIREWHSYQRSQSGLLPKGGLGEGEGGRAGSTPRPDEARAGDGDGESGSGSMWRHEYDLLPFEMVVLEVALKEVVDATSQQVKELEGVAMPALDSLTRRIDPASLERVRKVKTRHQRLLIKCETLRDEMERFLGDDDDMMKMCLTRKLELEQASPRGAPETPFAAARSASGGGALARLRSSPFARGGSPRLGSGGLLAEGEAERAGGAGAPSDRDDLIADMEVVENLLESYYMQIDGLYDKVVSLDEYIKDTEEYINIELDASRNRLIRLDIILTAGAFAIAPFNLLAGVLGENVPIPAFLTKDVGRFYALNLTALLLCLSFFAAIVRYMKYRRLI